METEASHMLEAALEQMDDIIAGMELPSNNFYSGFVKMLSCRVPVFK